MIRTVVIFAALLAGCGKHWEACAVDAEPWPTGDGPIDASADAPPDAPSACPSTTGVDTTTEPEVAVGNDTPAAGIFDPSIVYPAGASAGAMSYSAVPDQETIRTHVAVSTDHGATWTLVAEANAPEAATIASSDANECPGGTCSGNLISEVSSIVFDAGDPDTSKRWKLFAHRYLAGANVTLHYRIGTITLQTAPGPNGPWTAPQKLIGWTSPASYTSTGVVVNVNSFPGTADCITLTEPGALVLPGSLELALGCVYPDIATHTLKIRVELLRSTDHGASWASVSTLLRADDSGCVTPSASINAADLFVSGGVEYVVATPSDAGGYHGCLVYPVDDIVHGGVRRDASGAAVVVRAIEKTPDTFTGACTFSDGAGGYTMNVGFAGQARTYRIFHTGITTP